MDKKQTTATCPKCGEEIVQCENCENTGCPDCDGFVVTRDDVILCPECAAACKEDCDKMRAIGFLSQNGAFLVTKSGDKIAKYFGISKYTLYSYIDKQQEEK